MTARWGAPQTPPTRVLGDVFAPVAGFPGYFVNDAGDVLSVKRGAPQPLRPLVKSNGYVSVNLTSESGERKTLTVHPLVAEAFVGPRPPGQIVRHYDGNRLNNRVENLLWGTHEENYSDAVRHGTKTFSRHRPTGLPRPLTHCHRGHPFDAANVKIEANGRRACRACRLARQRARTAARRMAAK